MDYQLQKYIRYILVFSHFIGGKSLEQNSMETVHALPRENIRRKQQ